MELKWHIGDVIKKLREQKHWNQQKLAKVAHIHKATVVRLEENAQGIKRETYEAVAAAFEITMAQLHALVPGEETQRAGATTTAGGGFRSTGTEGRADPRNGDPAGPSGDKDKPR